MWQRKIIWEKTHSCFFFFLNMKNHKTEFIATTATGKWGENPRKETQRGRTSNYVNKLCPSLRLPRTMHVWHNYYLSVFWTELSFVLLLQRQSLKFEFNNVNYLIKALTLLQEIYRILNCHDLSLTISRIQENSD